MICDTMNQKIYDKITTKAKDLVATGDRDCSRDFGIPVVNKTSFRDTDRSRRRRGMSIHRRIL